MFSPAPERQPSRHLSLTVVTDSLYARLTTGDIRTIDAHGVDPHLAMAVASGEEGQSAGDVGAWKRDLDAGWLVTAEGTRINVAAIIELSPTRPPHPSWGPA